MRPRIPTSWIFGTLAFALMVAPVGARADTAAEVAVKAAVVHKIAKFVSWPATSFESDDAPLQFCVAGRGMMYAALQKFDDRTVHGRPVRVYHVPDPMSAVAICDVLYLNPDDGRQAADWLRAVADDPVLTFGEAGQLGADDSIVTVTIRRNKVRFAINTEASDRAGLDISAQLLQLAAALGGGGD